MGNIALRAVLAIALVASPAYAGPVVNGGNCTIALSAGVVTEMTCGSVCKGGYITVVNTSATLVATGVVSTVTTSTGIPICDGSTCVGKFHSRQASVGTVYGISAGTPTVIVECGNAPY
jgi:hypothetical protein